MLEPLGDLGFSHGVSGEGADVTQACACANHDGERDVNIYFVVDLGTGVCGECVEGGGDGPVDAVFNGYDGVVGAGGRLLARIGGVQYCTDRFGGACDRQWL